MKNTKTKKILTSVGAVALAVLILLGGTFAWQSISQIVENEKSHTTKVGARLHDDFNGEDKNVYVENYGSEGESPLFARVKLTEYLEIGQGAGLFNTDAEGVRTVNPDNQAESVIDGASILDKSSWSLHIPDGIVEDCGEVFHSEPYNVQWTMGGGGTYMPTFNTDRNSLEPDQRGHWIAPNNEDNYKDYKIFAVGETEDGQLPNGDTETHTAAETLTTTAVLTMAEWVEQGSPVGPYWVYDTDGWAYWAQPIQPGTATGFLLDRIDVGIFNREYYYAIDVIGQFCSPGDLFNEETDGGITEAGSVLINKVNDRATGNEAPDTITVTPVAAVPATGAERPSTVLIKAEGKLAGGSANQEFTYTVSGTKGTDGIIIDPETGAVTITDEAAAGNEVTVTATSVKDPTVSGTYTFTVELDAPDAIDVTTNPADLSEALSKGDTITLTPSATLDGADADVDQRFTYTIEGTKGADGITVDPETGVITIGDAAHGGNEVTVTVASAKDPSVTKTVTFTIEPDDPTSITLSATPAIGANVERPAEFDLSVTAASDDADADADASVTYTVESLNGKGTDGISVDENGKLTVSFDARANNRIRVTATSAKDSSVKDTITFTTDAVKPDAVTLTTSDITAANKDSVAKDADYTFSAAFTSTSVTDNDDVNQGVTYTVSGTKGTDGISIDEDGKLTITDAAHGGNEVTVTAASTQDSSVSDTYTFTIALDDPTSITLTTSPSVDGTTVDRPAEVDLTVSAASDDTAADADADVTYTIESLSGKGTDGISIVDGKLTVAETARGNNQIRVTATSAKDSSVTDSFTFTTNADEPDAVTVTTTDITSATKNSVPKGADYAFTATFSKTGVADNTDVDQAVTWSVEGTKGETGISIDNDGKLTITDAARGGNEVTVTATAGAPVSPVRSFFRKIILAVTGASGDVVTGSYTFTIALDAPGTINLTTDPADLSDGVEQGGTFTISASVSKTGVANEDLNPNVTYTASPTSVTVNATIGVVTVPSTLAAGTSVTITATSAADSSITQTVTFSVKAPSASGQIKSAGAGGKVTIDNIEWYVLDVNESEGKALLWAVNPVENRQFDGSSDVWNNSALKTYLNGTWASAHSDLADKAIETTYWTRTRYNGGTGDDQFTQSTSKFFLLSEADVFGTQNGGATVAKDYTLGGTSKISSITDTMRRSSAGSWLRSPRTNGNGVAYVGTNGSLNLNGYNYPLGVRPAFFYNLAS